jgi:hypothetical protein
MSSRTTVASTFFPIPDSSFFLIPDSFVRSSASTTELFELVDGLGVTLLLSFL